MALKRMSSTAMETAVAITNLSRKTGLSAEAIQKMQGSAVIVSQKEIQDINAANREMYKLSVTSKSLAMVVGGEVAKSLGQLAKRINQYLKDNPRLIDQIRSVARGIGSLIISTARLAKIIYEVIDRTIGWKWALIAAASAFTVLKLLMVDWKKAIAGLIISLATSAKTIWANVTALWGLAAALWTSGIAPIILAVTAIIAAMVLTINDLWTYFTGGKSVIGELLPWLRKFFPIFNLMIKVFGFMKNVIGKLGATMKNVFSKSVDGLKNKFKSLSATIKNGLLKSFNALKNSGIGKFFGELGGTILRGVIEHLKNIWRLMGNIGKLFLSLVKFDKEGISTAISGLKTNVNDLANNSMNTTRDIVGTVGRAANNVTTSVINNFNGDADRKIVDRATQKTVDAIDSNYAQYRAMQPAGVY
jgi:hypothetical protein